MDALIPSYELAVKCYIMANLTLKNLSIAIWYDILGPTPKAFV